MTHCTDRSEFELFLQGKLDPERMMALDRHLTECEACRAEFAALPAFKRASIAFGTIVVGANECPEYEDLSAFVEGTLVGEHAGAVAVHANMCELCARDIERIRELRSQASLGDKLTVRPGMTLRRSESRLALWNRVFAGIAAAVVIGVTVTLIRLDTGPSQKQLAAKRQPTTPTHAVKAPKIAPEARPAPHVRTEEQVVAQSSPQVVTGKPKTQMSARASAPRIILRDGGYRVIQKDNKLLLARVDGTIIKTPLEARIMAAVAEKLRTGRIRPAEPVRVAMNTMLRHGEGYTPPPTAPVPVSPDHKIVLTDRPTLTWSRVDLAESYRVVVKTESGNVVFDQQTDGNSVTVTEPLRRGAVYSWQVGVRFSAGDDWANSRAARFRVLSDADYAVIQAVKSQMPGSHLALGAAYEAFGLYDEAAAEYRALARANPNSSLARDMLRKTAGLTR